MSETQPALRLETVTKRFGEGANAISAVDDVSLRVASGELVMVMGPSGSGKTTLLSVAGGLMRPDSGRVWVGSAELTALRERDLPEIRLRRLGFVFQSANLLANLTTIENVRIVLEAAAKGRRAAEERARQLLGELGLLERTGSLPAQLSGGERQRVAIARALANDPELILADEPTANLDSRSGYQLVHTLERLTKESGKSVVVVTHDQRIADVADRTVWLEDGQLSDEPPRTARQVRDPVCGMRINPDRAAGQRRLGRRTVSFCSDICLERFDRDPDQYRARPREKAKPRPDS